MEALVTLRLDRKTQRKIARIAEQRRISKSEVMREALRSWAESHETEKPPYEAMAKFIGVVNGGDAKRSENGGRKFKAYLKRKQRES